MADPNQNPPINPNLNDAVNSLHQGLNTAAVIADKFDEILKRVESKTEDISKKFKNVNFELTSTVEYVDDIEDAVKEVVSASKNLRKGIVDMKSTKDAKAAVEALRDAQEILLKRTKDMPGAQAKLNRMLQETNRQFKQLEKEGELTTDQMKDMHKFLTQIHKETEGIAKNFKSMSVNHLNRQLTGLTGALKTFGIGKGFASSMEKYVGYSEVAKKIREAQRSRFDTNKGLFAKKREEAFKAVQDKYGSNFLQDANLWDEKTGKFKGKKSLGNFLGANTKNWTQKDYAYFGRGDSTDAIKAAESRYHGTGLTGLASRAATGVESGLAGIGDMIAEAAPVMVILEAIQKIFDGYVDQNKDIEKGIAKGGLFAGGGFSEARRGLNPDSTYGRLGVSFDRNLKIAQAISESGYSVSDIINAGEAEESDGKKRVGPAGEGYMAGGTGMIQRAVVGAGRLAGLTDAEGVQRVIKLLGEYRETLEQGENFFIQVSKGAKAAGLSTTKYISIIDEVMGRFDRMNRSLDATVSVMGELSKSGRLASEDIEDYFKFLTGGMGSQETAGTSEQMFLLSSMSKGEKKDNAKYQQTLLNNLVDRAAGGQLDIPGVSADQIRKGFGGSTEDMTKFIENVLQPAINSSGAEGTKKISWNELIEQMRSQKQQADTADKFSKGDISAVGYGFSQKLGMNQITSSVLQRKAMDFILKSGQMKKFMEDPMAFAAKHLEVVPLTEMLKNNPKALNIMPHLVELAGSERLKKAQEAAGTPEGDHADEELYHLAETRGFKINFKDQSAYKKFLMENGDKLLDGIDGMKSTMKYWTDALVQNDKEATEKERAQAQDEANKVSKQTRNTADIFADAFSHWFTLLIEGLEGIIDALHPFSSSSSSRRDYENKYLKPGGDEYENTKKIADELGNKAAMQRQVVDFYDSKGDKDKAAGAKSYMNKLLDAQKDIQSKLSSGVFFTSDEIHDFLNEEKLNTDKSPYQMRNYVEAPHVQKYGSNNTIHNTIIGLNADQARTLTPTTMGQSSEKANNLPLTGTTVKTEIH